MKPILDYLQKDVVSVWDDFNLWSAPFARLLLENIPMTRGASVLDVGFGTGFPLIELSQRFGNDTKVYGIDMWPEAINRSKEKIKILGLENIEIFAQSAEEIPLDDESIDLVCSNLGVNNFENKTQVLRECHRVLNKNGSLCLTTNPIGTFAELFEVFKSVLYRLEYKEAQKKLEDYLTHRQSKDLIIEELSLIGFACKQEVEDKVSYRFVQGEALLYHGLIRVGFRQHWDSLLPVDGREAFYQAVQKELDEIIFRDGEFKMSVPILYLEFVKGSK